MNFEFTKYSIFYNKQNYIEKYIHKLISFCDKNTALPKIQLSLFQKHKEDFTPGVQLITHIYFHIKIKNIVNHLWSCISPLKR